MNEWPAIKESDTPKEQRKLERSLSIAIGNAIRQFAAEGLEQDRIVDTLRRHANQEECKGMGKRFAALSSGPPRVPRS
jgi:hypothetical protein